MTYNKGKIDGNIYDEAIVKKLSALDLKQISDERDIDFKVSIPKDSDILDINLDVSDVEVGIKILQNLYSLLLKEDNVVIEDIIRGYDQEIRLEKIKLDENSSLIASKILELGIIDKRITSLEAIAADAKANNKILITEQKKLLALSGNNEQNSLAALLYTNTIQGNLLMLNNLMNEINLKLQEKQTIKSEKDLLGIKTNEINEIILKNEDLKKLVGKMVMLMSPTPSIYPIKPKKIMIVTVAGLAGFFLMILTAFFREYLSKYQEKQKQGSL